ncbi:hypothetical protein NX801_11790 [Streptomyces sp. LP05-1]|uniref:Large membrane protein n=1 Tax=Streptomyces pyxinae TaxID=2970734 RepID=A0ABT2CFY3_9ACTN|nr:hypothetical protein [Streptomyces sp. LP05-1]
MAAAVLLAGGGGTWFAVAASDDGSGRTAPGAEREVAPPPLRLDGHTEEAASPGSSTGSPGPGIAPGEPAPGGVVYRAAGELPQGPDSARVHRPRGTVAAADVTRLARALGLTGEPRSVGADWQVGPAKDGTGPSLRVSREAPGTWTYQLSGTAAGPTGDNCLKGKECPSGGVPGARDGAVPGRAGGPVGEEAAKRAAAPVLAALGQKDAALDASQVMGAERVVNADPVVGGLPTYGWSTGLRIGPDGAVTGGSGRLKAPAEDAEYPVIGAREALALLNADPGDGGAGIAGCATPAPLTKDSPALTGDAPAVTGDSSAVTEDAPARPCEPKAPGARETVTVTGARFGLAAAFTDGRPLLVPSWLFEVAPKGAARPFTITYPAVAPDHLAPAPGRTPRPSDPGSSEVGTPGQAARQIQSYQVDGRKLTAHFWGGVCSTYALTAEETASRVRLTVVEKPTEPGRACVMIAKEQTATVTLKAPLGARPVLDAASGERVPLA